MQVLPVRSQPGPVTRHRTGGARDLVVVAGAHGGAGTTTLAILLQPAWDVGVVGPPGQGPPPFPAGGGRLVLVSRNTAVAAGRAVAAVNALSTQGVRIAVLAVVSDGLPEPAAASYRFRLLEPRAGVVVRVPFVAALRATDDPAQVDLPPRARRVLAGIRDSALGSARRAVEGGQLRWA